MKNKDVSGSCCAGGDGGLGCCKIESLITVDDRGQMVLPKEVRERANIKPGDKFALVSWEQAGKICCISLIRAGDFSGMIKSLLGPMLGGTIKK